jgi:RNA polymerase sigma-70 factor (ECF subfamily)
MSPSDHTRWSLIRGAAEGRPPEREEFARRYDSVIRAYCGARWRHTPLVHEIDDAVQDVFLDCFRPSGALERVDPEGPPFRAYLYGVVRNVARRVEERRIRAARQPDSRLDLAAIEAREEPLSVVFDRAWALAIFRQAADLHASRAEEDGDGALRRVDLLRLRFHEGIPIREIARRRDEDPARLHHEYARARDEFRAALRDVVAEHHSGTPREVAEECARLASFFR